LAGRSPAWDRKALYVSRDVVYDWLIALPFGHVSDGQPDDHYRSLGDQFRWCLDGPGGTVVGFEVSRLLEFDPSASEYESIWDDRSFDAPLLGLTDASAGEIVAAAKVEYDHEPTINRVYFNQAMSLNGYDAVATWKLCLEAGDSMAHFGLGHTLLELGELREAYAHLRHYAEIVPTNAWAWCWLGKACSALGEVAEARTAYRRALALEEVCGLTTDARECLEELDRATSE
jgi:tetratricopeptide (TPR) repeat protein